MTQSYSSSQTNHGSQSPNELDLLSWFDHSSDHPDGHSDNSGLAKSNGDQNLVSVEHDSNLMIQQSVAAIVSLKAELEKTGALEKSDLRDRLQPLVDLIRDAHAKSSNGLAIAGNKQKAVRQQVKAIAEHIHQANDLDTLFTLTVTKIRETLQVDRVLVYQFTSADEGVILAESINAGWTPTLKETIKAFCFGAAQAAEYEQRQIVVIDDVSRKSFPPYQRQLLEKFQIKTAVAIPIVLDGKIWGLLALNQCSQSRKWQEAEISFLEQLVIELTLTLQPLEFHNRLQQRSQQEQLLTEITQKVYRATDAFTVLRAATQDLRQLLQCDRAVVYRFNQDWTGEFIAEAVGTGWTSVLEAQKYDEIVRGSRTENDRCILRGWGDIGAVDQDTYLKETRGGKYAKGERLTRINDVDAANFTPCYRQSLEKYQARAYVIVPLFHEEKLWGLLGIYQNSGPRDWSDFEVDALRRVAAAIEVALQHTGYIRTIGQEESVVRVIDRIRRPMSVNAVTRTVVQEVRQLLECDRVAVYRFNRDWSGEFVAESVGGGWASLLQQQTVEPALKENISECSVKLLDQQLRTSTDTYLKHTKGETFSQGELFRVADDIYSAGFSKCYIDILESYQAKAYIIVAVYIEQKLWGLLAAYQNSGPRRWQESEINWLTRIGSQLGIALQQAKAAEQFSRSLERDRIGAKVIDQIRKKLVTSEIFGIATREIRNILHCDRVSIYRFAPDWSGTYIAESVGPEWIPLVAPGVETAWADTHLKDTQGGRYRNNESFAVDDIHTAGHSDCHIEVLEQFQIKAYMITPIFHGQKLWGLLAVYQNSGSRYWQEDEVKWLSQIGVQLGLTLQQAEYLEQIQKQSQRLSNLADLGDSSLRLLYRLGRRTVDMSKEGFSVDYVLRFAAQELRRQMKADRVAVYQFRPDWSGEFIIEDVSSQWVKLTGSEDLAVVTDTHLQDTQGGRYRKNESLRVEDIYTVGHADCHIAILEQFQARAYIISPIFKGEQLWGLLGVYQNSAPRYWEELEEVLVSQTGAAIGIALQQGDYLEQLDVKSQQLVEAAEREKAMKNTLQQEVKQLLMAVRPALEGDLTVRAPLTEDEVGTVADAYNSTIQALRRIVIQVQGVAEQVGQTSRDNGAAIATLAQQAQQEAEQITGALNQVQAMVDATQVVASSTQQVKQAVQQANQTVQEGDAAMNRTVNGILAIRETVSETTRKIKRLSESSQKISKVVNLINNFTTQTHLLALNAAIEATRAGEYGRGFAVVADEVRSLARQSAEATTDIERLVQEIQMEISAVATAMDVGIEQVVEGTSLVNVTRQSLNAIVSTTAQISELVQDITQATQSQIDQTQAVTQTMNSVAAIANRTSADSIQISASFQELLTTAERLQESVGRFKVS